MISASTGSIARRSMPGLEDGAGTTTTPELYGPPAVRVMGS
jgi:hypothetical protein